MHKTTYRISKMDCPAEEHLVRMKLEGFSCIHHLDFDLKERKLRVYHHNNVEGISTALKALDLGASKLSSEVVSGFAPPNEGNERKILLVVLFLNFGFFFIEIVSGFIADSMGLVADSLDMLADAFVYALSLWAVSATYGRKKRVARLAGYLQLLLAVLGFMEVIRRYFSAESSPDFITMIIVSILALGANVTSLYLLRTTQSNEAHIRASMIFTSNDVVINIGVILAAILVHFLHSPLPDLIVGAVVFLIIVRGSVRIMKLAR